MPINKNELTKEMIEKAMQCKSADELIALAKTGGYEMTKEEAEAYMTELSDHGSLLISKISRELFFALKALT